MYAICEEIPSIIDGEVLAIAVNKDALLITEGKDFGELVFRLHLPHKGILLIRIEDPNIKVTKVANTIANYCQDLYGKFAVIDETKLRIKE